MAIVKQLTVFVSRKISKDYNSTDHSFGVTLDVEEGEDISSLCAEYTTKLKDEIRKAFNGTAKPAPVAEVSGKPTFSAATAYPAERPTQTGRNSDPEPYSEREKVIDPLTQRPVVPEVRSGNTSDQAIARGHLPKPDDPKTWPECGTVLMDVPATTKSGPGFGDA